MLYWGHSLNWDFTVQWKLGSMNLRIDDCIMEVLLEMSHYNTKSNFFNGFNADWGLSWFLDFTVNEAFFSHNTVWLALNLGIIHTHIAIFVTSWINMYRGFQKYRIRNYRIFENNRHFSNPQNWNFPLKRPK